MPSVFFHSNLSNRSASSQKNFEEDDEEDEEEDDDDVEDEDEDDDEDDEDDCPPKKLGRSSSVTELFSPSFVLLDEKKPSTAKKVEKEDEEDISDATMLARHDLCLANMRDKWYVISNFHVLSNLLLIYICKLQGTRQPAQAGAARGETGISRQGRL